MKKSEQVVLEDQIFTGLVHGTVRDIIKYEEKAKSFWIHIQL